MHAFWQHRVKGTFSLPLQSFHCPHPSPSKSFILQSHREWWQPVASWRFWTIGVSEPGLLKQSCLCPGGDCKWDVNRSSFVWMAFIPKERNSLTAPVCKADLLLLLLKLFIQLPELTAVNESLGVSVNFLPSLAKQWLSHLHFERKAPKKISWIFISLSLFSWLSRGPDLSAILLTRADGRRGAGGAVFLTPWKTSCCFARFLF